MKLISLKQKGFTLIELLVVIAIIGILATIVFSTISPTRAKARDSKRKVEVAQIGRLLSASCYVPDAGVGEYDIKDLVAELAIKYPQYAGYVSQIPIDPSSGSATQSRYMYIVNASSKCAVYANLENDDESTTLTAISAPTPGGGTGVLTSATEGWNGSFKYFQMSN